MSEYDFATRLTCMLNKECSMESREIKIAKKCAKYYNEMYEIKTMLEENAEGCEMLTKEVEKMKLYNQNLEKRVQEREYRLAVTKRNVQELKKEYETELKHRTEMRKAAQMKMALLHQIKETTQTCFNMNALPNAIVGAKYVQMETSWEWIPFAQDVKEWITYIENHIHKSEPSTDAQRMTV